MVAIGGLFGRVLVAIFVLEEGREEVIWEYKGL